MKKQMKIKTLSETMRVMALIMFAVMFLSGCASTADRTQGEGFQVNPFLWRASLEVISFMPLAITDPAGGVIATSWYSDPKNPNERSKITIYILDRALRADALRVAVFRESNKNGKWRSASTHANMAKTIENLILTQARTLRLGYETTR